MKYRKEIDGLRAIAVLPVILFHAGSPWFSGGYVGVDVFFVISGFLITNIILTDLDEGRFSIVHFYERRARRILPALITVLVFTSILAIIFMPPDHMKSYAQSVVSVIAFSSNVFFYLTNDYFSTVADEKPLLHTWSLAVEEQYYLFFPLILSALWFAGKHRLFALLATLTFMSLVYSQSLANNGKAEANFYLIFSRAWELFAGSLLAFAGSRALPTRQWVKETASVGGMLMIFVAIYFYNAETPFPGLLALPPVFGTCIVLAFADQSTFVGRLLCLRALVFTGIISYSLYLWHQPLFAFLRLKTVGEPSPLLFGVAIAATFAMSVLSQKYIEAPFRDRSRWSRRRIFSLSAASLALMAGFGLAGHVANGFPNRFNQEFAVQSQAFSPRRDQCHTSGENYLKPSKACRYHGDKVTWAAFGDSHLVEPAYALADMLRERNEGVLHLTFSGCPPALLLDITQAGCKAWMNEALQFLKEERDIRNILLGFRYSSYLYGNHLDHYPSLPDRNPTRHFRPSQTRLSKEQARDLYWQSYKVLIEQLLEAGKKVYVVYPVPCHGGLLYMPSSHLKPSAQIPTALHPMQVKSSISMTII